MKNIILLIALFIGLSFASVDKIPSNSKLNKLINEEYGFVKSGLVLLEKDTFSVQSFLMSKKEVTNLEYGLFLKDLQEKGEIEKYNLAKPDSAKWNELRAYFEPMAKHYHNHVAFRNYPVVNVTQKGAELYCEWYTEQFNKLLPAEQQINFRLPLKAEWLRAACGDNLDAVYTWKGPYLRNSEGMFLANFTQVGDQAISKTEEGEFVIMKTPHSFSIRDNDQSSVTAPSKSYSPNEFGIYNMNGNVAEMLANSDEVIGGSWYDGGYDIRNRSVKKYKGASPTVGFRVVATIVPKDLTWFKPKK